MSPASWRGRFDELLQGIEQLRLIQAMRIATGRAHIPRPRRGPPQHPAINNNFQSIRHPNTKGFNVNKGNMRRFSTIATVSALAVLVNGCKKHDNDNGIHTTLQAGRFIDVQGLTACSGKTCGVTGALGEFQYEITVNFKTQVKTDETTPKATPTTFNISKDLALPSPPPLVTQLTQDSGAYGTQFDTDRHLMWYVSPFTASADPIVQRNIMLVLLMVDHDGDPTNGIQIADAVRTGTLGVSIDWSSSNPRTDYAALQVAVIAADPSGTHEWAATDDAALSHFTPVWQCALSGVYNGSVGSVSNGTYDGNQQTQQVWSPTFTDTDGAVKVFTGGWNLITMPSMSVGGLVWTTAPFTFHGFFTLNGGALQGGTAPTATLSTTQYVDAGEFAPKTTAQIPFSLQMQLGQYNDAASQSDIIHPVTGGWSGGGFTGGEVTSGSRARTDFCYNTNTSNNTTTDQNVHPDCQAFAARYKFAYYPVWIQSRNTNNGQVLGADPFVFRIEIGNNDLVMASFNKIDEVDSSVGTLTRYPLMVQMDANNGITLTKPVSASPGYQWQFKGTLNRYPLGITGELYHYDGTHVVFDQSTNVIQACSTVGKWQ